MTGEGTTAVHGGAPEERAQGPVGSPLYRTSTFRFDSVEALRAASHGDRPDFYTRYGHPNFEQVEDKYAALHGAEAAVLFASGMGAIAGVILATCRAGDRVVAQRDIYGGTRALLGVFAARFGLETTWVETGDLAGLDAALPGARLFLGENPTNPLVKVIDLAETAARCGAHGVTFVLDATFDGPINLKPLRLGVDLVVESATKSLGGHSDLVAGLVAGGAEACGGIRETRRIFGAVADPDTAWLLDRGLKTLQARVLHQNRTAAILAARFEGDPRATEVRHPALDSHPQRALLVRQAEAAGGTAGGSVVAFRCAAGAGAAEAFCDNVKLVANAPSLGGVESLVSLPRYTSHAAFTPEERAAAGIEDDHVRLSIGLEDPDDLWADIDAALG